MRCSVLNLAAKSADVCAEVCPLQVITASEEEGWDIGIEPCPDSRCRIKSRASRMILRVKSRSIIIP